LTQVPAGRRVLHAIGDFGTISESFLTDRLVEIDRAGWESWVGTQAVANRDLFPYPPDERLLRGPSSILARVLRREAWPMDRFIAAANPHVVHAHFGWTAAEVLPAVKRAGLPLVAGFHGYDATVFPRYGWVDLESEDLPPERADDPYSCLFDEVDCVLVVSRFLEGRLRELGLRRRIEVVPSGIRLSEFPFRGPRTDASETRLIFVGRQVAYKGLDVLLRALSQLPGVTLDVVGGGPGLEGSRALAEEAGVSARVAFHGEVSRAAVLRALRAADVLVAPSRTMPSGQAEGLGNVIKEALAVGLQVVATRNGGIPEAVPPALLDELVPESDADALAQRLAALIGDRRAWDERAKVGRQWVEQTFDWTRLAPRITAVYDDLA
jgi:glycosyltransferase involved in cell wall biosynthesis